MVKKAPLIILSGLDGSGKSTVLEHIQAMTFPAQIKGVKMGHRRPGVVKELPPTGPGSGQVEHYAKPNRSALASAMKLGVMTLDWLVGSWTKLSQWRSDGYLVVFDRHYLIDLDIDPNRYRYGGPLGLVKLARGIVPKPNLVIFLDVPEEVSMARKNEPSAPNFEEQRQAYLKNARESKHWRIIDATQPLEKVLREVETLILQQVGVLQNT